MCGRAEPRKKDLLEQTIVTEVQKLNDHSNAALNSSHSLMHSYRVLIHLTEKRLGTLAASRSGGKLYISSEYEKMASAIAFHSALLISQVKQIQERLRNLVSDIEKTKEQARKRALRRRIWSWLVKTFRAISFLISAGGAIFALFHPLGLLDTAAITVASMLSGAVAKLCENTQKSKMVPLSMGVISYLDVLHRVRRNDIRRDSRFHARSRPGICESSRDCSNELPSLSPDFTS